MTICKASIVFSILLMGNPRFRGALVWKTNLTLYFFPAHYSITHLWVILYIFYALVVIILFFYLTYQSVLYFSFPITLDNLGAS